MTGNRHWPQHLLIPESLQIFQSQLQVTDLYSGVFCFSFFYLDNVVRKPGPAALQDSSSDLNHGFPHQKLRHEFRRVTWPSHISEAKNQQAGKTQIHNYLKILLGPPKKSIFGFKLWSLNLPVLSCSESCRPAGAVQRRIQTGTRQQLWVEEHRPGCKKPGQLSRHDGKTAHWAD